MKHIIWKDEDWGKDESSLAYEDELGNLEHIQSDRGYFMKLKKMIAPLALSGVMLLTGCGADGYS